MENQSRQASPVSGFSPLEHEEPGLDVWGFLRRRKGFVILLAVVGTALGYVNFLQKIPRYSSDALVQVIHHNADPRLDGLLAGRNLVDAQYVITSETLLDECYENHDLGELATLRGIAKADATRRLAGMIVAKSPQNSSQSNILKLSCEGTNPVDTARIANAVAAEFVVHHTNSFSEAVNKLAELLAQAKDQLNTDLDQLEEQYKTFDANSLLGSDGQNPHTAELNKLQANISELVIRHSTLKSELRGLEEAIQRGANRNTLLMMIDQQLDDRVGTRPLSTDTVTNSTNVFEAMFPLLLEESILSAEVGSDHPKLVALRLRIRLTEEHFEALAGMAPKPNADGSKPAPLEDFLTVYLHSLAEELAILERKRADLEAMASQKELAAKSLRSDELERADYERKIARLTGLFEDVQQQIRDTELPTSQLGGVSATILNKALHGVLVYPRMSQFLGIGGILGAFVGLVLGYFVEAADRSFRKPEEIVRQFGLPIVAHIPFMREQKLKKISTDAVMDRTVIACHLPRSQPSEAYRSARTAVCFGAQAGSHRVIQVTSPAAGDGKSTLAVNLAVCLAQSGKQTLIMESDFRRPKVHKLTGVSNKTGIVDVLRGDVELADVIQDTEVDGLSVLPCGKRPRDPSELLTRPEYEQLIAVLREKYDYVIIDSPPVLVVNDPCSVAPRADAVLLCVRLSRHTRDFGVRAVEQLSDVGANISGIVINGVEEADAYGYGNYRYSDYRYTYKGYGYGGYGYRYKDRKDGEYFADGDNEEPNVEAATDSTA